MIDLIKCPWCEGSGEDGHDRCYPPNPYLCYICNGTGRVSMKRWDIVEFIQSLENPEKSMTTYIGTLSALQGLEAILLMDEWGDWRAPKNSKFEDEDNDKP
jgi:hypothetical protein